MSNLSEQNDLKLALFNYFNFLKQQLTIIKWEKHQLTSETPLLDMLQKIIDLMEQISNAIASVKSSKLIEGFHHMKIVLKKIRNYTPDPENISEKILLKKIWHQIESLVDTIDKHFDLSL